MLFNSFEFLIHLLITLGIYYLKPLRKFQVFILLASSLLFYAWAKPWLVGLLILSILINSISTLLVSRSDSHSKQKLYAVSGILINLGLLAFFKYNRLLLMTLYDTPQDLSPVEKMIYYLPLPVGISFFTFQGISLLVDVYREKTLDQEWIRKHPLRFITDTGFFISFFPHSVSGPIVKAKDFYPQIGSKLLKNIRIEPAFQDMLTGYFLKMVVADNLKEHTQNMTFPYFMSLPSADLGLMLFGYSMQIFADFAGYSLIAIGLARLFGYELKGNFLFPYISTSFKEFWKRWHISLSSWLQEYLYYSLGGNRKGEIRTYINLMTTMVLGGLWHGAAWSYAVWGAFHGLVLVIEKFFTGKIVLPENLFIRIVQGLIVFTGVSLAWLLFRLPEFHQAVDFLLAVFNNTHIDFNLGYSQLYIILYSIPVIVYHFLYLWKGTLRQRILNPAKPWILGMMLFLILSNSGIAGSFIYFRF